MRKYRKLLMSLMVLSQLQFLSAAEKDNLSPTEKSELSVTKKGDWITRLRALYLYPLDHSSSLSTVPNSGVSVNPAWTGEFDFGYMFTDNLGSELILATSHHTLHGEGALAGTKIGSSWLLPPTLTLQWRFMPKGTVQPYLGAGVNFTLFYSEKCSIADTTLKLGNSWGPAGQVGLDWFFHEDWLMNFDIKYIYIKTKGTLTGAVPGTVNVWVNPLVFGVGFGRRW